MDWWNRLDPTARTGVMVGVPLVAIAALVAVLRGGGSRKADEEAPGPATPATPAAVGGGYVLGGGGVINMGELGGIFSEWSDVIGGLPDQLEDLVNRDRPGTATQPQGTNVAVLAAGETWKALLRRHYGPQGTNLWGTVRAAPANAQLVARYPSPDARLPGGSVVFMPARNW